MPNLIVYITTPGEPADFFFAGLVLIVSSKLRDLLAAFKVDAEFLPTKTFHMGREYSKDTFYFLNILGRC